MNSAELLAKVEQQYTIEDVQAERVEAVSVMGLDQLDALIAQAVEQETSRLRAELAAARAQLDEQGGGGDGLEQAAAEAALEAESRALEAKALAEQRAQQAEARVKQLEAELSDAQGGGSGGDGARVSELEAKLAELEPRAAQAEALAAQVAALEQQATASGEADALRERVAALEAELAEAKAAAERVAALEAELTTAKAEADKVKPLEEKVAALEKQVAEGEGGGPAAPVTDADRKQARRLAEAILEEVFSDDEAKTNEALAAGKFREVFADQLQEARRQYVKRVPSHVRAEVEAWDETLAAFEAKTW